MVARRARTAGEVLRWSAAVLTAAAAAVHFAVTPEHFEEDWVFGVFFASAAWAQLAWALLATQSEDHRLLLAGVGGNLAIALVWAASRTTGLPLGPDPGEPEAVQFIDVLATALEVLAAASTALALRLSAHLVSARRAVALIVALALVVIPTTTTAIATGTDRAHSDLRTGRTHAKQAHR